MIKLSIWVKIILWSEFKMLEVMYLGGGKIETKRKAIDNKLKGRNSKVTG